MSKACYDPRAAPEYVFATIAITMARADVSARMFERLGKIEEQQGVMKELSFMYTHPSSQARVEASCIMLEAWLLF